jgi:hypothetical protein
MKEKIQIYCCSFNSQYSSCGTRTPKRFTWTNETQNKVVVVDGYLKYGLTKQKNKFGWLAESPAMCGDFYRHIFDNLDLYKKSYIKIFTCDENLIKKDSELFAFCFAGSNMPWTPEEEYKIHNKTKLISFLCSNKNFTEGHKKRLEIAESFKGHVDFYGGVFGGPLVGVKGRQHYHHKRKTEAINPYMFSVTVENCLTDTYFTEKITDCFANGVIPIYYGTKKVYKYFDQNGIIFLDESFRIEDITEDLYYSKMEFIKNNLYAIKNMPSADDMLYESICCF